MKTDILALKSFRDQRTAAGLPVASDAQLLRAKRILDGNPTIRSHRTPLGIELLALNLPLDKNERRKKELEGIKYEPIDVRSQKALEELAEPSVSKQFFEGVNPVDEDAWLDAVCEAKSISRDVLARQGKRIARFFAGSARRVPAHIREMMVTMGVAAYGLNRLKAEAA